jgi:transcriptional regulator with GAF, ATPase, and Fis domain
VKLCDLGSRNGTFYAGQRVGELTLTFGSHFTLGSCEFAIESDAEDLEATGAAGPSEYGGMVGRSAPMRRLFGLMKRLEGSLVNVLIRGESGTGKELIARALHEHSRLKGMPFVALNCGALDRALVRSELFGYKKGAFTGAISSGTGAFEEADGGTLFLDEIGELPLDVQPVLLRVLESGEFSRVGESPTRPAKVRVIAATNRKLKDDVERGTFRADLYYRLMVVELVAQPLRERREDIPLLTQHLCREIGIENLPAEKVGPARVLGRRGFRSGRVCWWGNRGRPGAKRRLRVRRGTSRRNRSRARALAGRHPAVLGSKRRARRENDARLLERPDSTHAR